MKILTEDSSYELSHFRGGLPHNHKAIENVSKAIRGIDKNFNLFMTGIKNNCMILATNVIPRA